MELGRAVADLLNLALAEQGAGAGLADVGEVGPADLQVEGLGQADRLVKAGARIPPLRLVGADGVHHQGALDGRAAVDPPRGTGGRLRGGGELGELGHSSVSASGPGSYSCTGWAGMMVEMACL